MAWIASSASSASSASARGPAARDHIDVAARSFLGQVYRFMSLGLATTGLIAMLVASSPAALSFFVLNRMVFFVVVIAQFGMVMAFAPIAARVSARAAALMFFAYSALSGVTFSSIFLIYTSGSIAGTFLVTAGMFAGVSAYGAITRRSLDSVGSFCFMGLIGLVIASVVNIFLGSPALYWLTTFMGVIVFTGLAAYDTAKMKTLGATAGGGQQQTKLAMQGALILYLDFINLFLMLLRLFGGRRRD